MIYGNNGITPTRLYGEVADNFLESVGVSIFDDGDIAIGESIFDLSTGCDILEENGVILCEDCIVLEGKQAEEYKARKAKEREEEANKYDKYDNKEYSRNITPKAMMGSRANKHVGDKASLKQLSFNKGSFRNHNNTKSEDRVRRNMVEDFVERDRLSRHGSYSGKGMEIRRDKKGNTTSYYTDTRYDAYNKNGWYGDRYSDEEKNKRIAHNAARDAANRHLRRHSKYVKESTIFSDIEIV